MPKATLNIIGSIGGFFDDFSFEDAFQFFTENADADSYEVVISSPGGSVSEGFAIANLIEAQEKPVTCIAYQCMSIATVIFLAGSERLVSPDAEFMIHNPWVGMVGGDAGDLERTAEDLRRIENKLIGYYNRKTGAEAESIRAMMNKETFIEPAELVSMGFATGILEKVAQNKRLTTYAKAVAYYNIPKIEKMEDRKTLLADMKAAMKELFTAKSLQLALVDGRVLDVRTRLNEVRPGDAVSIENESVEDGTYETVEGQILSIQAGKVEAVENKEIQPAQNAAQEEIESAILELGEAIKVIGSKIEALTGEFDAMKAAHESEILNLKKNTASAYTPPKSENVKDSAEPGELKTIELNMAGLRKRIRERQKSEQ